MFEHRLPEAKPMPVTPHHPPAENPLGQLGRALRISSGRDDLDTVTADKVGTGKAVKKRLVLGALMGTEVFGCIAVK